MIHTYKQNGFNIILDIASGAIHSADDAAYDAVCIYEEAGHQETGRRIKEKYRDLSDDEISELLSDIEALIARGKLFSPDVDPEVFDKAEQRPVKALCLNVSHACDMTCAYCFANRGGYTKDGELMSFETGKRAIDVLVQNSGGRKTLDVDFFGGEPLLNWGVVKGIVGYARSVEKECGKKFRFTLTTNGTKIDDDVISFTNREMHNVVLSVDGRPGTNDAFRKLSGGAGSYSDVVPKIQRLVQARRNKDYYIRSTYTKANLDFSGDVLHLADLGFTELSSEPVVSETGRPYSLTMSDLPELQKQYEILAVEMLRRSRIGKGFSFYHFRMDLTGGPCVHKRTAGCGVGTEYLAVAPGGSIYPCHQFVGEEGFLIGDVWGGIRNGGLRREFGRSNIHNREVCKGCWARYYCSGGCAANAYYASGSIGGVYELGCELLKKRVECAIMMKVSAAADKSTKHGTGPD